MIPKRRRSKTELQFLHYSLYENLYCILHLFCFDSFEFLTFFFFQTNFHVIIHRYITRILYRESFIRHFIITFIDIINLKNVIREHKLIKNHYSFILQKFLLSFQMNQDI